MLMSGYSFSNVAYFDSADGAAPSSALVADSEGNLYGTTASGGLGFGTIYEIAADTRALTTVYVFKGGVNGVAPNGSLLIDQGILYGTTEKGGLDTNWQGYGGVVYSLSLTDHADFRVLHSFRNQEDGPVDGIYDGDTPIDAGLTLDANGNLYGVTSYGGQHKGGVLFELVKADNYHYVDKHDFKYLGNTNDPDGSYPIYGLTSYIDANNVLHLYGTAAGGQLGAGVVFEWDAQAGYSILWDFADAPGTNTMSPVNGLARDGAGNLYGTVDITAIGGAIYRLTPGAPSTFQMLATLPSSQPVSQSAGLVVVPDPTDNQVSDLYGLSQKRTGSVFNAAVFEIPGASTGTSWQMSTLAVSEENHDLAIPDSMYRDSDGNLFGTVSNQGGGNYGTVFEVSPGAIWTGGQNTQTWNDAGNWNAGPANANYFPGIQDNEAFSEDAPHDDTIVFNDFNTSSATTPHVPQVENVEGVTFDTSTALTLSTAQSGAMYLTEGGTIATTQLVNTKETIDADLVVLGSRTAGQTGSYFVATNGSGTGNTLTLSGSISGDTSDTTNKAIQLTLGGTGLGDVGGSISNGIGGAQVSILKTDSGKWTLNPTTGSNTYGGGTKVYAGTLYAATPGALPYSDFNDEVVVYSGATLMISAGAGGWTTSDIAALLQDVTFQPGAILAIDNFSGAGVTLALNVHSPTCFLYGVDIAQARQDITDGIIADSPVDNLINAPYYTIGLLTTADYAALSGASSGTFGTALRYTWLGDINLDGTVDLRDYRRMDLGYATGYTGDPGTSDTLNYGDVTGILPGSAPDGIVDFHDYAAIDQSYSTINSPPAAPMITEHAAAFGSAYVQALVGDASGTLTLDPSVTITNYGTLELPGSDVGLLTSITNQGTIIFLSDVDLSGLTLTSGNYEIAGGVTASVSSDLTLDCASFCVDSGATVSVGSAITAHGYLFVDFDGTIDVNSVGSLNIGVYGMANLGTLNVNGGGAVTVDGVELYNNWGTVNVNEGGVLTVENGGDLFNDFGTVNVNEGGALSAESNGILYNDFASMSIGGVLTIGADSGLENIWYCTMDVNDGGIVTIEDGGALYNMSDCTISVHNGGVLSVESGGFLETSGTLTVSSLSVVTNGGTISWYSVDGSALTSITNQGTVCFESDISLSGLVLTSGTYEIAVGVTATADGGLTVAGATLRVDSGGALQVTEEAVTVENGWLWVDGVLTLNGADLAIEGTGWLWGSGEVSLTNATLTFTEGSDGGQTYTGVLNINDGGAMEITTNYYNWAGTLNVNEGGNLTIDPGGWLANYQGTLNVNGGSVTNRGTLYWQGSECLPATGIINQGNVVFASDVNLSTVSTLSVSSGAYYICVSAEVSANTFGCVNRATLVVQPGATLTVPSGTSLINYGTIRLPEGSGTAGIVNAGTGQIVFY